MKKTFNLLFIIIFSFIFMTTFDNLAIDLKFSEDIFLIKNVSDILRLFPKTIEEMDQQFELAKNSAEAHIQQILSIPQAERTFDNTVLEFDKAVASFEMYSGLMSMVKYTYPDNDLRRKSEEILKSCADVEIDLFKSNKEIYKAFRDYQAINQEVLSEERAYYFSNIMLEFKAAGFELPDETFLKVKELHRQISSLAIQFQTNISEDNTNVYFSLDELTGLSDDFIKNLTKEGEKYILDCNAAIGSQILANCSVEVTRKRYAEAYRNLAFPQNIDILNQMINLKDELAQLLGFRSYAELSIASTMAETVERVESFLEDLSIDGYDSIKRTYQIMMNDLPPSVKLTEKGQLKSWDVFYTSNSYLKKHLNVDQDKIAEYFPVEITLRNLLNVYEKFFNLKFQVIDGCEFWDPSVQLTEVRDGETNKLIGYVVMDLIVRENKYTNACCACIIPPISHDKGHSFMPSFAIVLANFPKSTENKPSLLKHMEVQTFFHEFGHAIHALLGKAEMPTKSGYNTKFDFVEAPSQLLEEWIWDHDILKQISHHYQTGESLPDDVIASLIKTQAIKQASRLDSSLMYSKNFLRLFKEGKDKDLVKIKKDVYDSGPRIIAYDDKVNGLCSFVHLTGYGPKYYTYLWSEQMAKKIFRYIKSNGGLLDPVMGKRYISKIIGRGGSCNPNQMMADFLGAATSVSPT